MSFWLVIAGIVFHAVSGVPGLLRKRDTDAGQHFAAAMGLIGSALGITGALLAVFAPQFLAVEPPAGFALDGISVIFLLPIFLIPALGGVYGLEYWKQADHPDSGRKLRLFYGLITASLALVTISAHAIIFLVAWEIMALSAFFLITSEDEDQSVREVGWIYLVATHLATLCLFAMFAIMRSAAGSFSFADFATATVSPQLATAIFLLAAVSFGLKAGVMPLHIWLPGAHAMSPSHVSALMSGVLIKIGIFGLVRILAMLPHPPIWWGATLLVAGVISGVFGVVFAIGQHDLKRLLAYHSVENIGIIVIGIGLAMIGRTLGRNDLIMLGFAGGLLHVWNHGLFKSLLFFSAGSVIHATHTRDIDHLGGLAKNMPKTALCFALGAVAICGLPPLNGFVSELLIYLGLFRSIIGGTGALAGAAFAAPALALIGGLAVACFVKAFGSVFLGQARSTHPKHAHEASWRMTRPMFVLAGICLFIGLAPLLVAPVLENVIHLCAPELPQKTETLVSLAPFVWVSIGSLALVALIVLTSYALRERLRRHGTASAGTWDCGYAAPSPTMQYTASSFAQMLVQLFAWVLHPKTHAPEGEPLFAHGAHFRSHVPDYVLDVILRPTFRIAAKLTTSFRFLQQGSVHAYLFYIVAFLIFLLIWK